MNFYEIFQITVCIIYLLIISGRLLFMRWRTGINPFVAGRKREGIRLLDAALLGIPLWLCEIFLVSFRSSFRIFPSPMDHRILDSPLLRAGGAVLIVSGLSLFIWALISFGDSLRIGIDNRRPGRLVTSGAFALSRNPIYFFLDSFFVGIFLINGTWTFLVYAILGPTLIHFQILEEERFLQKLYGREYEDYCRRTARYMIR